MLKNWMIKYGLHLLFMIAGGIVGYIYWVYLCNSAICIDSTLWHKTAILCAVLGFIFAEFIADTLSEDRSLKQG